MRSSPSTISFATMLLLGCCWSCVGAPPISLVPSTLFSTSAFEAIDAAMDSYENVVYITSAQSGVFRLGNANAARFSPSMINPNGITCDASTNIFYISSSFRVWSVNFTSNSIVWFAGGNNAGYQDGVGTDALFNYPTGIVSYSPSNILYVADTLNNCIRKINLTTNRVTTITQQSTSPAPNYLCVNDWCPNYLCINRRGTILYATNSSKVVGIFTANGTSFDVVVLRNGLSSLQGITLNFDEAALIVADTNILKLINLSTTMVTPIAHTTLLTPTGLKWYCLKSGVCGVLVADTTKVSFLRMRPASISASVSSVFSNSQSATISTFSSDSESVSASNSASRVLFSQSLSCSTSPQHSVSRSAPTLSISSESSLTYRTISPSKNGSRSASYEKSLTDNITYSASLSRPSPSSSATNTTAPTWTFTATVSDSKSKYSTLWDTRPSQSLSLSNTSITQSATNSFVSPSSTSPNCSTPLSMSPLSVAQASLLCSVATYGSHTLNISTSVVTDEAVCTPIFPSNPDYDKDDDQRNSSLLEWQYSAVSVDAAARSSSQFLLMAFALDTSNIISGWVFNHLDTSTTNTSLLNYVNRTVLITMSSPNAAGTITLNFVARCALERVNVTVMVTTPQQPSAVSTIAKISTAVAVSAAAAFGNDASTTASLVLLSLLSCTSLSPDPGVSGYAMSFFYNYGPIAMVTGNIGIGAGLTVLFAAAVFVLSRHLGQAHYDAAAEILRFPAVPIHIADFFLPGTLFASFLCFWSTEGGALPTGVVGACIVAGYVAGTQTMHERGVRPLCIFTAYFVPYPTGHPREASILFPRCRWSLHTRNKYSPLLNPFVAGKEWTRTLLLCLSLLLGAVSGMASSGVGCSVGAWIVGVANIVAAFALMFLRPFRLPTDKWIAPLTISLIGLSCILKATGDADLASASDGLTAAASMLQILRTLLTVWVQAREDQWNEEGRYSIGAKFLFWLFREQRPPPPLEEEPLTFDALSSTSVQHPIMLDLDVVKDNRAPTSSYVEKGVQMIDFAPVPPAAATTRLLEHTDVSLFAQEDHMVFEGIDGYFMLEGLMKAPFLL